MNEKEIYLSFNNQKFLLTKVDKVKKIAYGLTFDHYIDNETNKQYFLDFTTETVLYDNVLYNYQHASHFEQRIEGVSFKFIGNVYFSLINGNVKILNKHDEYMYNIQNKLYYKMVDVETNEVHFINDDLISFKDDLDLSECIDDYLTLLETSLIHEDLIKEKVGETNFLKLKYLFHKSQESSYIKTKELITYKETLKKSFEVLLQTYKQELESEEELNVIKEKELLINFFEEIYNYVDLFKLYEKDKFIEFHKAEIFWEKLLEIYEDYEQIIISEEDRIRLSNNIKSLADCKKEDDKNRLNINDIYFAKTLDNKLQMFLYEPEEDVKGVKSFHQMVKAISEEVEFEDAEEQEFLEEYQFAVYYRFYIENYKDYDVGYTTLPTLETIGTNMYNAYFDKTISLVYQRERD